MEDFTFNALLGTLLGLFFGIIIGTTITVYSFDNDAEEKDCVDFFKKNNYITEKCEIYSDKLEKSEKND